MGVDKPGEPSSAIEICVAGCQWHRRWKYPALQDTSISDSMVPIENSSQVQLLIGTLNFKSAERRLFTFIGAVLATYIEKLGKKFKVF